MRAARQPTRRAPLISVEALLGARPPTGVSDELRALAARRTDPLSHAPRAFEGFQPVEDAAIRRLVEAIRDLTRRSPEAIYCRAVDLGLQIGEAPMIETWIDALATLETQRRDLARGEYARATDAAIVAAWDAASDDLPTPRTP